MRSSVTRHIAAALAMLLSRLQELVAFRFSNFNSARGTLRAKAQRSLCLAIGAPMLINYGHEITIAVAKPTPVICLLDVHPERRGDVQAEAPFCSMPAVSTSTYTDAFGNQCRRLLAPAGDITLRLDGTIADGGRREPVVPQASEVPVGRLPHDALLFLLGSRYCETDKLSQTAWDLFGAVPPGWKRVQAIADYVHGRITFGYSTRAQREPPRGHRSASACAATSRTFHHILPVPQHPRTLRQRLPRRHRCAAYPSSMDFSAWIEVFVDDRWYTFDPRNNEPRTGRIVVARGATPPTSR